VQIVVTHDMSDFDALASALAAQKLYPGSQVVLGRRLAPPVRDFLSLHRQRFPVLRPGDVDPARVRRLIVVDVRRSSRLGDFAELVARARDPDDDLEVHIYDHHAAADDDLVGTVEHVEPVGAVTTLMVEELGRRGEPVDTAEATLFALGIYADTGAFTHAGTTGRDLAAAAWLLERGANLRVIHRFLKASLSQPQRDALALVLENIVVDSVCGVDVGVAVVRLDDVVEGLAAVTEEAFRLEGVPALLAIYDLGGRRVQVVARSGVPYLDVGRVLESLGGGGHAGAAAVILKDRSASEVRERVVSILQELQPRPTRVGDLMSSPVRTVAPEMSLRDLRQCLRAWQHSGVPVVRDGTMVGIVSQRDVERAAKGGRLDLPVSSCMRGEVRTATADMPLDEALQVMVRGDFGRLPVVRGDKLVGIVSRTDVMRAIYGDEAVSSPSA
jgi:tRNA nucleotidyltransferase (CCA-adding enzyme)